jgi:hypothetical protein
MNSHAESVVYFIEHLDIDMVDTLLDNKRTYQDFNKNIFIQKLGNAFNRFLKSGDTKLEIYHGNCISATCSAGCKGIRFIGDYSGLYMDLILKIENGLVIDIYECHQFKTISPKKTIMEKVFVDTEGLPLSMM